MGNHFFFYRIIYFHVFIFLPIMAFSRDIPNTNNRLTIENFQIDMSIVITRKAVLHNQSGVSTDSTGEKTTHRIIISGDQHIETVENVNNILQYSKKQGRSTFYVSNRKITYLDASRDVSSCPLVLALTNCDSKILTRGRSFIFDYLSKRPTSVGDADLDVKDNGIFLNNMNQSFKVFSSGHLLLNYSGYDCVAIRSQSNNTYWIPRHFKIERSNCIDSVSSSTMVLDGYIEKISQSIPNSECFNIEIAPNTNVVSLLLDKQLLGGNTLNDIIDIHKIDFAVNAASREVNQNEPATGYKKTPDSTTIQIHDVAATKPFSRNSENPPVVHFVRRKRTQFIGFALLVGCFLLLCFGVMKRYM